MIYLCALIGTLAFIAIQFKIRKQKVDDGELEKFSLLEFLGKEWDDFVFAAAVGQGLAFFQKYMFFSFVIWKEWDIEKAKAFYEGVHAQYWMAAFLGLFGSFLIIGLYDLVKYVIKASKAKIKGVIDKKLK